MHPGAAVVLPEIAVELLGAAVLFPGIVVVRPVAAAVVLPVAAEIVLPVTAAVVHPVTAAVVHPGAAVLHPVPAVELPVTVVVLAEAVAVEHFEKTVELPVPDRHLFEFVEHLETVVEQLVIVAKSLHLYLANAILHPHYH